MTFKANNEALRRMTSMQVKPQLEQAEQPSLSKKPWLTETFRGLDQFLIIPFSRLFNVWHVFLLLAVWYNIVIVPYSIGGDVNLNVNWYFYVIDWIAILIHFVDIWFRANTALTSHREICLNKGKILSFYIETFLLTDVLATIPFEYMLLAFKVDDVWRRWIRVLRLLKLIRVNEIVQITKFHANINLDLFMIFRLFVFYPTAAHVFACVYVYICNREVYQDRRFDGNEMYENINVRNFLDLPPIPEMDHFSRYVQCFYMTSG